MLFNEETIQQLEAKGISFSKEDKGPDPLDKVIEAIDKMGRQITEAVKKVGNRPEPDNSELVSLVNHSLTVLREEVGRLKSEKRPTDFSFEISRDKDGRMIGGKFRASNGE